MRNDEACLREITDALRQLTFLLRSRPDAERLLTEDRLFRHSVFFEFVAIGESISGLSAEPEARYPEVPWRRIGAFRHRVAHGYFSLSISQVWQIWRDEIPSLVDRIEAILELEFPTQIP